MNKSKKDYDVYLWSGCAISDENGNFSGDVLSSGMFEVKGEFGDLEEPKALMAAAPEMLGALKGALKYLKNQLYMDGHTTELLDTYEIIKSAIVKAEGK